MGMLAWVVTIGLGAVNAALLATRWPSSRRERCEYRGVDLRFFPPHLPTMGTLDSKSLLPRAWIAAVSVAVSLVLTALPAVAQEERYRLLAGQATDAVSERRFEEAFSLFREMHALQPSARTLWSMGRVRHEQERFVDALHYLELALEDERRPLEGELRAEAESLRNAARALVAELTLDIHPPNATALIDDAPLEGEVQLLDPGEHRLRVEAPGHVAATRRIVLRSGEQRTLALRLEPSPVGASVTGIMNIGRDDREPTIPSEARLALRGEEGLTLLLGSVDQSMASVKANSRGPLSPICTLPCPPRVLSTGQYHFAVERADDRRATGVGALVLMEDAEFAVEYWDRDATRGAGLGMAIVGGLLGVGLGAGATAMWLEHQSAGMGVDLGVATFLTVGAVVGGVVALVGLFLQLVPDRALVRTVTPTNGSGGL